MAFCFTDSFYASYHIGIWKFRSLSNIFLSAWLHFFSAGIIENAHGINSFSIIAIATYRIQVIIYAWKKEESRKQKQIIKQNPLVHCYFVKPIKVFSFSSHHSAELNSQANSKRFLYVCLCLCRKWTKNCWKHASTFSVHQFCFCSRCFHI